MAEEESRDKAALLEALKERRRWQRQWDEIPKAETDVYGEVLAPKSTDQLIQIVYQVAMPLMVGAWRGHAAAAWKLDSSLARRWHDKRDWFGPAYALDEPRMRRHESAIVEEARRAGFLEPSSELELFARLQHHGAATRLLDCTRNAFVALWFASRELPDTDGMLLGFRLSDDRATQLDSASLHGDLDKLIVNAAGRLLWWRPRTLSPRIAAQQAVFVLSETVSERWGSISLTGARDIQGVGDLPGLVAVLVSRDLKHALNSGWEEVFGFTEQTLFPDFDGFALSHAIKKPFPTGWPI